MGLFCVDRATEGVFVKVAMDLSDSSGEILKAIADGRFLQEVCVLVSDQSFGSIPRFSRRPSWHFGDARRTPESVDLAADFCRSCDYSEVRHQALRMLDREDPSGSFRMVDREALFHAYCLEILDTQLRLGVEIYVADVTPHEFVSFLWWKLAAWRGLKVLFFQPCGIGPFVLPRLDIDVPMTFNQDQKLSTAFSEDAREFVTRFFARLKSDEAARWVTNQRVADNASRHPARMISKLRALFSSGPRSVAQSELDFSMVSERFHGLLWFLRNFMVRDSRNSLRGSLAASASPESSFEGPYVLFLLHYEPERTSRPEGGMYSDQFRVLLEIRKHVSKDVPIVVKEHYSQISGALRGHLGRSRRTYPLVASLPNTYIARTDLEMIPLVRSAECVVTLTGTIGIEAPYLGTRVIYFGEPWWAGIPGTVRFRDLATWSDIEQVKIPSNHDHLEAVANTIASRMTYGLAGESLARSEDRWGRLPDHLIPLYIRSLTDLISEV